MKEINVLDKQTAELIAAGEVVDRPASVVKELIENSIDAGSDLITIEIKNGGISYIRISDNGIGIDKSQVEKAFLRHATSKIRTGDDLDRIFTLGFRGEALASIAAMCKVEIMTKTYENIEGTRLVIEGGEEKSMEAVGCPVGTTIVVRDIFFNTPARMKFLKKDVTEGNSVAAIIEKVAISHPEVGIKFIRDGSIKLHTPGDNKLISAISAVYGKTFAQSLVSVQSVNGNLGISGFISKPQLCKNSRRFQNFFINKRYVKCVTAMAALEEAYKNSLMVGKFPACILNITVPPNSVDVNVHPAKIEVRFSDEKKIFNCVYYGVKNSVISYDSLESNSSQEKNSSVLTPFSIQKSPVGEQQRFISGINSVELKELKNQKHSSLTQTKHINKVACESKSAPKLVENTDNLSYVKINNTTKMPPVGSLSSGDSLQYFVNGKNIYKDKSIKEFDGETCVEDTANTSEVIVHHMHDEVMKTFDNYKEIPKDFSIRDVSSIKKLSCEQQLQGNNKFDGCKIIGELFSTYIVLELKDKMILVDKHAAHERLIFEKLRMELYETGISRQSLLTPINVNLDTELAQIVIENKDKIEQLGFCAEDFGDNTILIREIPMFITESQVDAVFCDIVESIQKNKCDLTPEAFDDLLHSMACKAAIKAKDKNNMLELNKIVNLLNENEDVKYCPHGRPIYISFTKREIEKLFGRTK